MLGLDEDTHMLGTDEVSELLPGIESTAYDPEMIKSMNQAGQFLGY